MFRSGLALTATVVVALSAGVASAGDNPRSDNDYAGVKAVDYIRDALTEPANQTGKRSQNTQSQITGQSPHWRASIFDGRRTRATNGTGLNIFGALDR